jgi:hypothetical protein
MREEEPEKKLAQRVSFASLGMCCHNAVTNIEAISERPAAAAGSPLSSCSRPHPLNDEAITA